jgi:integrase
VFAGFQRDLCQQQGVAFLSFLYTTEEFRTAYEAATEVSLRVGTASKIAGMFNVVEELMKLDNVKRITPQWLTKFQRRLLECGRAPATVESHFRHLKAAMNWAKEQGVIPSVPQFPRLKQARSAKVMKGRPITGEEFERMLAAVDVEFPLQADWGPARRKRVQEQRDSIKFLLRGLWLPGLRLEESLTPTWDRWADGIRVDFAKDHVLLLIPAESEKGGRDRVYPTTADFAEFLRAGPEDQRQGFVFNPVFHRGLSRRLNTVSDRLVRIGKSAQVKVDERAGKAVWASAHDLRRAFAARWAMSVPSMVLKELMRHQSIATTEKYYVGQNAEQIAVLLARLTILDKLPNLPQQTSSDSEEEVNLDR